MTCRSPGGVPAGPIVDESDQLGEETLVQVERKGLDQQIGEEGDGGGPECAPQVDPAEAEVVDRDADHHQATIAGPQHAAGRAGDAGDESDQHRRRGSQRATPAAHELA